VESRQDLGVMVGEIVDFSCIPISLWKPFGTDLPDGGFWKHVLV